MALFKRSKTEELESTTEKLLDETVDLLSENIGLNLKIMKSYSRELVEEISGKLNLTSSQKSKLEFIFSRERARMMGAPEDKILHDKDEVDEFFTRES